MSVFTSTWDSTFEGSTPSGSDLASSIDTFITSHKNAIRERVGVEHEFDFADQADQGTHKSGSAKAYYQGSAPTKRPNGIDSLDSDDAGRLFVDSGDDSLSVWNGSSFDGIAITDISGNAATATRLGTASTYSTRSIHSTAISQNDIFDKIAPYIPNTGDSMLLNGTFSTFVATYVIRSSGTLLTLFGGSPSVGAINTLFVTDGSGTQYTEVSVCW